LRSSPLVWYFDYGIYALKASSDQKGIVNPKNYIAMTTLFNSDKNFNELIFENKNKEYGAYAIRNSHNETITKSLGITLTAVALLVFLFVYLSKTNVKEKLVIDANLLPTISTWIEVKIKEPEKVAVLTSEPKDPLPPKTDNLNLMVNDKKEEQNVKPVDQMNVGAVQNNKGTDSAKGPEFIEPKKAEPPVDNTPKPLVTEMPEFIGDMYKFIRDNLRYPEIAKENGTQGIVGLSFVVEKDGSIGEVKILGRVPDGCTEEAVRVVKMMPKWKPGKNHGELVRVIFNIPVKFKLK
jgi:protein TonB